MGERPDDVLSQVWPATNRVLARYWPLMVAAAVLIGIQWPWLKLWWAVWNQPYSYFSHGPLVPFIAGYMIWANKKRLAQTPIVPSWHGLILLLPGLVIFVLGQWTQTSTFNGLALLLLIFGAMVLLLGVQIARLLAIPVLFMATMIPTSAPLLDNATGKFQLQSAAIAAKFLGAVGYAVTLEGTSVMSSALPEPLVIGIPCSGLRTLISLITFTVFFVYMVRADWWKKAILLGASFPLSIFINSLRIFMIGLVGFWTGSPSAMHKFHDYSGYIGLAICFALLFGLARLLRAGNFGLPDPKVQLDPEKIRPMTLVGGGAPGVAVLAIYALAGFSIAYASPIYPQTRGHLVRENTPMRVGSWYGQDLQISTFVSDQLKHGDLLSRSFTDATQDGRQIEVFITASRNPDAFHDPHTCLPANGSPITEDRVITFALDKPRPLTIRASLLQSANDYDTSLVLYWYMMGPDSYPRTGDVWQRKQLNLVRDLTWLLAHPTRGGDLRARIESRQFYWYRFSTSVWTDEKHDLEVLKKFVTEFVARTKGFGE